MLTSVTIPLRLIICKGQASQHQNCLWDTSTLHCKDRVNIFLQLHSNCEPKTVDSIQFTATTVPTLNMLRIPNLNVTDLICVPWMLLTKLLCLNPTSVHSLCNFFPRVSRFKWYGIPQPFNIPPKVYYFYLFNQCTQLPDTAPSNF